MQAVMLAAGKGSRLGKYTKYNTKCMLEINEKTLLERSIDALCEANIKKLILVLGYKKENVKKFIKDKKIDEKINIIYIDNEIYDKTNNIYSLYLAKDYLINEDTILLESDIIYSKDIIKELVNNKKENMAVLAKYRQWMDGTVVELDNTNMIKRFIEKKDFDYNKIENYYKTVNIYKFSKEFSQRFYVPFLQSYMNSFGNNEYYELVLKVITGFDAVKLYGLVLTDEPWYEIDDAQDLDIAKALFTETISEKLDLYYKRFGGYWRFDDIKDYCYLVNPYFPSSKVLEKMKYLYKELLTNYPSGQKVLSICASRMFNNVSENNILVGNGAAELINNLKYFIKGKICLSIPSFNEYVRCFPNNKIEYIYTNLDDYQLNVEKMKEKLNDVECLIVISPDNPSGDCLTYEQTIDLLNYAKNNNKLVIFDESFIDFANNNYSLIDDEILNKYTNLIVIKSVSKSYGVPGLRLGIFATSNQEYMKIMKDSLPVWNINSFGEYFLQIISLYKKDYINSCNMIKEERNRFYNELINIKQLKVYSSQANYFMCKLIEGHSNELAEFLLKKKNILIKILNNKKGFSDGEYIRIAIKNMEENMYITKSIKEFYSYH